MYATLKKWKESLGNLKLLKDLLPNSTSEVKSKSSPIGVR